MMPKEHCNIPACSSRKIMRLVFLLDWRPVLAYSVECSAHLTCRKKEVYFGLPVACGAFANVPSRAVEQGNKSYEKYLLKI